MATFVGRAQYRKRGSKALVFTRVQTFALSAVHSVTICYFFDVLILLDLQTQQKEKWNIMLPFLLRLGDHPLVGTKR